MDKTKGFLSTMLILYNIALVLVVLAIGVISKNFALLLNSNRWFLPLAFMGYFLASVWIIAVLLIDWRFYKEGFTILEDIWLKKHD